MSLARRHRDGKKLIIVGADHTAAAALIAAALADPKPSTVSGVTAPDGQILPPAYNYRRGLAWRHAQKHAGAAAAVEAQAANDNAGDDLPAPTPYDLTRSALIDALRQLKLVQSVEKKVELKARLMPQFLPWVEGALEAAAREGRANPDEIVATMLVWSIDVADYALAVRIGEHMLRHKLAMPERFKRQPAVLLTEEIADAALAALGANKPFPGPVLTDVEILTVDADMPDEVRARLYKAMGLDLLRAAEEEQGPNAVAGFRQSALNGALGALRRAQELHDKVGVKKQIERLERELKKDPADVG